MISISGDGDLNHNSLHYSRRKSWRTKISSFDPAAAAGIKKRKTGLNQYFKTEDLEKNMSKETYTNNIEMLVGTIKKSAPQKLYNSDYAQLLFVKPRPQPFYKTKTP